MSLEGFLLTYAADLSPATVDDVLREALAEALGAGTPVVRTDLELGTLRVVGARGVLVLSADGRLIVDVVLPGDTSSAA